MPPATDHKNIIGSIVKVESASTILMRKMMSEKLGQNAVKILVSSYSATIAINVKEMPTLLW